MDKRYINITFISIDELKNAIEVKYKYVEWLFLYNLIIYYRIEYRYNNEKL